jgi:prolyl-tRNA synthetase
VRDLLEAIQSGLLERARKFMADNTTRVSSWEEFRQIMASRRGFLIAGWCGDAECEAKIKQETKATVRVIPLEGEVRPGACIRCGRPSPQEVYFAQAY